jgi:hypothetical protein
MKKLNIKDFNKVETFDGLKPSRSVKKKNSFKTPQRGKSNNIGQRPMKRKNSKLSPERA